MLHITCVSLGSLIFYYEITFIGFRVLFQYSGWFLLFTTLLHFLQLFFKIPNFLAYVAVVIGLVIVLPASIPSLITLNYSLASYLLYDLGNHLFLPLCTLFHLENVSYRNISSSLVFLLLYNIAWVLVVEFVSDSKPYGILDNSNTLYRFLFYAAGTFIEVIGLFVISVTPCIRKTSFIRV